MMNPIPAVPKQTESQRSPIAAFVLNTLAGPLPMIGGMSASFGTLALPSLLKGEAVNGLALVSPLLLGLGVGVAVSAAAVHVLYQSGLTSVPPPIKTLRARRQETPTARSKRPFSL